ncbi:hypothetical protein Slala05_22090 [Streptomyces lavendulae subsp. lavendulae]|nr:hypothetical protein Slala05_22090 [Streptomyces lavendulae subsp. lavendulae]
MVSDQGCPHASPRRKPRNAIRCHIAYSRSSATKSRKAPDCSGVQTVRAAPEHRHLSDAEWGEIAQRIVAAAGIAPEDDDLTCRWIAVRHAGDHIHILATTVREDGRRPKLDDSGI